MHTASGGRLGAAHPRQEAPADLRLVPPALAAWATAALLIDAPPQWVVAVTIACLAAAGVLLTSWGRRTGTRRRAEGASDQGMRRRGRGVKGPERTSGSRAWSFGAVAAVLLCVAAAAASTGLHGADPRRGPVPGLVREFATVTAEVEVTADPRLSRPRVRGNRMAPGVVLVPAEVRRVRRAGVASVSVTRTPVLVMADEGERGTGPEADAGEPRASPWLEVLPSTRLRVTGRLAPAVVGGDRIAGVLRVRGTAPLEVTRRPSGTQRLAGRLRAGLREASEELPADARALLPGLVVGDTSRITPELDEAFKETDLAHLLAVSGSNLTIVLALLLGPPGLAQRAERRGVAPRLGIPLRTTALLGGVLTLGFVVVCRPDPSVLRAAACGAVALLALVTGRRRSLIPALATAVLLLVLFDPWLARSYGFLLSVLATGALLTVAPHWSAALRRRGVPARLAEGLAAAGAAQALCAPVVVVLSARVSLVAVPCNLFAEFAVAPATVLGFAALAVAPAAMPVAGFLAWLAGWPVGWIADVARAGAALPGGGVDWPGGWAGAALLVLVTATVLVVGRRLLVRPWLCAVCGALLLLVVVQPPPLGRVITGWPPPGWRLAMCDVGQGDALVLAAGAGSGVVVDAGPDPEPVDRCLRALGVTKVPLVVLTHFHADHVAGLPGVLRGRAVGEIQTTGFEEPVGQVRFVRGEAAARRVPVTRAVAGERRRSGDLTWEVVWPPRPAAPAARHTGPVASVGPRTGPAAPAGPRGGAVSPGAPPFVPEGPNDASVTLFVRSAGLRMLLLGDLEPPAQRALSRSPAAGLLEGVDVLKVAHHGSAYQDPDLIRRVAPRLALVSAGADNPYGHPAPGTVAALQDQGAVVLRTDRGGSVAVAGEGEEMRVARD
ncbi:ComEC/Rec2 family competence protein [Streptomyces sp. NPDC093094]|uniref:ComEC/Rec2 family competence protein n=1 Tax=Streptomyces sp. NPDC093094 TaxID=3366026 RepID=UPI0038049A40